MTWARLSANEWRRRPVRTSVTAAGVAIATAALFSLLAFQSGYRDGVQRELDRLGAHILVVPKGCPYDAASIALHGASWPCYLKSRYLEEVRSVPGIAAAAPVLMIAEYTAAGAQNVFVGVDTNMLSLKRDWRIEGKFPRQEGQILVGTEAARRQGWRLGDTVRLPCRGGQAASVVGLLRPQRDAEDSFVYMRLIDAQQQFHHTNELTHILVRLDDPDRLDQAVAQLRGCDAGLSMNVVPLSHLFRSIQTIVNSTRIMLGCIALVGLLAAGSGVANTILMAVSERTREIGVMRAIGASPRDVFSLIWMQTVQVCLAGAIAGISVALVASRLVEHWVRSTLPFAPADALVRWQWWIGAACVGCALGLGSLAGLLPAARASSIGPVEAMRKSDAYV